MIEVAVVGYGYWGPNLVRNFAESARARVTWVCDLRESELERLARRYPDIRCTTAVDEVLADEALDAVAIATPVSTHTALALKALDAGKHVLVTKPLSRTSDEARTVIEAAERAERVLLVDHTFVYTGAVQKVRELIAQDELGDLYYYDSLRLNLGLFQADVGVAWDLAVHDLSILASWISQTPTAVSCIGVSHVAGQPEDLAYMTLFYPNDFVAHINVNWLSPVKIRKTLLSGTKKMVVFDDLDPIEKIKVYNRGIDRPDQLLGTQDIPLAYRRTGDVWIPQIDLTEALKVEVDHFADCIMNGTTPMTGGREALWLISVLEAADRSAADRGRPVSLEGA